MTSLVAATTVCIICWIIINVIILPIDAYWLYKFYMNRDTLIIKKRKPRFLILQQILLYAFVLLSSTIAPYSHNDNQAVIILVSLLKLISTPLIWANQLLTVARYYLIFYMVQYNAAIVHNKWQIIINPTTKTQNWYLQNRQTIGSWKYTRKYYIIYGVIFSLFFAFPYILILCQATENVIDIFSVISYLLFWIFAVFIPVSIYIYILCKLPKQNDDIGIRAELKYSIYGALMWILLIALLITILWTWPNQNHHAEAILFYVWFLVLRLIFLAVSLKQSKWPLTRFKEIVLGRHSDTKMLELAHKKAYNKALSLSLDSLKENDENIVIRKEMKDTLQKHELLDYFMVHLLNEYCAECLLSIIEFLQFKMKIINDNKDMQFDGNGCENLLILPDKCPKSFIIYGDEDPNYVSNYKYMAKKLYNKYIKVGSEWEINIDYFNRKKYRELFRNNQGLTNDNKEKLYKLFDVCIEHMISLLIPAYTRFKNSKQYKIIQQYSPPSNAVSPNRNRLSSAMKLIPRFSSLSNKNVLVENNNEDDKL